MSLMKATDLGIITISNDVFADILEETAEDAAFEELIWPATPKGRIVQHGALFTDAPYEDSLRAEFDDRERIRLRIYVVVRFGISIRRITRAFSDAIASRIRDRFGEDPCEIEICVSGIRSKQTARRNLKVKYFYETE